MGFLVRLTAAEKNVPVGSNRNAAGDTHGADRIGGDNLGHHPDKPFRRSRPKQASAGKVRPPHVGRVNVLSRARDIDGRTAEAARPQLGHLRRHLAARIPLPRRKGALLPVRGEVGFGAVGEMDARLQRRGSRSRRPRDRRPDRWERWEGTTPHNSTRTCPTESKGEFLKRFRAHGTRHSAADRRFGFTNKKPGGEPGS